MNNQIKWTYDEYEYYNGKVLQAILVTMYGKENAEKIHQNILKEIREHQQKQNFMEKLTNALDLNNE